MRDLNKFKARVGGHNPRLIYLDPADKPEGERGGGPENLAAVVVGDSAEEAVGIAATFVRILNLHIGRANELDDLILQTILARPDGDVLNIMQAAGELPGSLYDRLSMAYHEICGNDADAGSKD